MKEKITRVKMVSDQDSEKIVKQIFNILMKQSGKTPNWARVMANSPQILSSFTKMFFDTMGTSSVDGNLKWKIAYIVSSINECVYCLGAVEGALRKMGATDKDIKLASKIHGGLKPEEKIAIKYAQGVTKNAVGVPDKIFDELKKYYNDEQIVEITGVIGLFNYINRFNDALRVLPE